MASLDFWGLSSWFRGKFLQACDDLSVSQRLVRSLALPSPTSTFVLALQVPQAPGAVVYILVAQQLSERSASDAHKLVAAVRPKAVVSQIEAHSLHDLLKEESSSVAKDAELSYPVSVLDVIRARFLDEGRFEESAGPSAVRAIFGTGFYGHVIAGKQAAALMNSPFFYLEDPFRQESRADPSVENGSTSSSTAATLQSSSVAASSQEGQVTLKKGPRSTGCADPAEVDLATLSSADASPVTLSSLAEVIRGASSVGPQGAAHVLTTGAGSDLNREQCGRDGSVQEISQSWQASLHNSLTSVPISTLHSAGLPRRLFSPTSSVDFKALSPGLSSALAQIKTAARLGESDRTDQGAEVVVASGFPAFALPLDPWLSGLHELYKELPGMGQALLVTRKMLVDVERGQQVSPSDLADARSFRVAVEAVRTAYNRDARVSPMVLGKSGSGNNGIDFRELPYEEQCNVLLAQALQQQARKFETVVAIVDACSVGQIRKHWNTVVPPEVAAVAEGLLVPLEKYETDSSLDKQKETKAVVVVGAGAVAAVGLASIPQWAPVSTAAKVLTFKVPAAVKLMLLQAKRSAAVFVAKMAGPASKVVVPSVKGVPVFAPASKVGTSAKVSGVVKTFASAGKTKAAARSMVAAAERASLSAIRMAFYSVMRTRQGKSAGSRPWLILGSSVAAGSALWSFGDRVERVIADLPSAPALARLGRGLENLRLASNELREVDPLTTWEKTYGTFSSS